MDITTQVISDFRVYFPEFNDSSRWSDTILSLVLSEGDEETGSSRWGVYAATSFKARGMFSFAAHRAVIREAVARATSAGGIAAGAAEVQSKSVGDESVSFAAASVTVSESAPLSDLNSTSYGKEFLRLRNRAGMGPAVV